MGNCCKCQTRRESVASLPPRQLSKWASHQTSSWMTCSEQPATPATTATTWLRCGRSGEFYGYRERIPSRVNIEEHPEEYWWSEADLSHPTISSDIGLEPTVISKVIKVTVVPSVFFASHRDIEVFPEYADLFLRDGQTRRLVIFKLKLGDQVMVSLSEVLDDERFDEIFAPTQRDVLLMSKFKLILSPINSPLPIPVKKPSDAETVGTYFGMDNVDFYLEIQNGAKIASIFINIYSKWIIRKFLPLATSGLGRICDFILLSSDDKTVYTDFRLLSTVTSRALIRSSKL